MIVLGVACLAHDTSAAVVVDGLVVAACEEERFINEKHTYAFPINAINWCLSVAGVSASDVDLVAFDNRPVVEFSRFLRSGLSGYAGERVYRLQRQASVARSRLRKTSNWLRTSGFTGDVRRVDHHTAHAANAMFTSTYEIANVLTADRGGDFRVLTGSVAHSRNAGFEPAFHQNQPGSIAEVYTAITWYLGLKPNHDEGQTMAMAGLCDDHPDETIDLSRAIKLLEKGGVNINRDLIRRDPKDGSWVSERFLELYGPRRVPLSDLSGHHVSVAYAAQTLLEESLLSAISSFEPSLPLCFAGGVALNPIANSLLAKHFPAGMHVPSSPGDSGNAVGSALHAWSSATGRSVPQQARSACLGPSFQDSQIFDAISARPALSWSRTETPAAEAADRVSKGQIIGWFQGREEFGPRALGGRSILADARDPGMMARLNYVTKQREAYRPFAPSVLADRAHEWFEQPVFSPYMSFACKVIAEKREQIPSVVHVDGSARLQSVTREASLYYELIDRFRQTTGVPVVLNTSLNGPGRPIASRPEDALDELVNLGLDALIIGNYVVARTGGR